ncbi:hypothetical protein [Marinivivus vitaminiproducens]|uniref:hypothetical protein n=1 Tax=Marinivivus vitaminiproducens TaxID=3035935 RepID=UPI00279DCDF7|nr:hypothetical protein P4R82_10030 [Geminicoccaceae bacterium SCSIO 64248]
MSKHLLPLIRGGILIQRILPSSDLLAIVVAPRPSQAACLSYATPSRRVHSRYKRMLQDPPWQGRPVHLRV